MLVRLGSVRAKPGWSRSLPAILATLALAAVSCAKREAPGGGPPDLVPPAVVAVVPDSGSAGVAETVTPSITFSEGMEPRTTDVAITMAPHVEIERRRWKGRTLTISFAESLQANRTYTLSIGNSARDRHGNPMATGRAIVFTTANVFPGGRIEGEIEGRGFDARGTQLWVYEASRTGVPDSTARDFDATGWAESGGKFRVDGLAVPGRYRVWGFADLNHNRAFEPEIDVLAPSDTVIELSEARPLAADLKLTMVNPRASGEVKGTVVDSLGDTTAVLRVLARSLADTTRYSVVAIDDENEFELSLQPGEWRIMAFGDLNGNRLWDAATEAASPPVELTVEPASSRVGLELVVRPRAGAGP